MGLCEEAATDLVSILEDVDGGFGRRCIVAAPDGSSAPLAGRFNDVAQSIDPDTGLVVSGRTVTLTLPLASIKAAGLSEPRAEREPGVEPWTVEFLDAAPGQRTFVISDVQPDRSYGGGAGAITCHLSILK